VGLVLGAGGIRGCAHAGVVKVLRDAGVPIDVVVGASVGAMFGLAVAAEVPTEEVVRAGYTATSSNVVRFYAGRLRLNLANPIGRAVIETGAGKRFEDLPLPFAVMATDMATGEPVVLRSGPVVPAIQASISIPFIARPVALEDRYFLDGGVIEAAPIRVARQLGAEVVIAVCLGCNYAPPTFLRRRWARSLMEQLGQQRSPITGRMWDQIRFGWRLYAALCDPPTAQTADVEIWPEFGRIGPNSFHGGGYCVRQGLKAAEEALPEIQHLLSMPQSA
jgi:NTE family protein